MIFYSICLVFLPYGRVGSSISSGPGPPPGPTQHCFSKVALQVKLVFANDDFTKDFNWQLEKKRCVFNQEDEFTGLGGGSNHFIFLPPTWGSDPV